MDRTHRRTSDATLARVLRLASILAAVIVFGETGHVVLEELNAFVAHHFFHIVFPLAAVVIFAGFVAQDIRRRGWPTFTWRLQPQLETSASSARTPVTSGKTRDFTTTGTTCDG
jgi:hypothetical protein